MPGVEMTQAAGIPVVEHLGALLVGLVIHPPNIPIYRLLVVIHINDRVIPQLVLGITKLELMVLNYYLYQPSLIDKELRIEKDMRLLSQEKMRLKTRLKTKMFNI